MEYMIKCRRICVCHMDEISAGIRSKTFIKTPYGDHLDGFKILHEDNYMTDFINNHTLKEMKNIYRAFKLINFYKRIKISNEKGAYSVVDYCARNTEKPAFISHLQDIYKELLILYNNDVDTLKRELYT